MGVVSLSAVTTASGTLENMVECGGPTRHTLQAGHGPRTRSGALWNKVVALGGFFAFFHTCSKDPEGKANRKSQSTFELSPKK